MIKKNFKEDFLHVEELKQEYDLLRKKYQLPGFSDLNKLFDIEDIDIDSELLLRKIRRMISDKIAGYMRLTEILLNPSNAPLYFLNLIKKLDNKDRENLSRVYETLGRFELELVALDLDYSEEREAKFIKKCFKMFNDEIKISLLNVVEKLKSENKSKKSERDYFG